MMGLWMAQTEAIKVWLHVVAELKKRAVADSSLPVWMVSAVPSSS